jgi:hypothetical protein
MAEDLDAVSDAKFLYPLQQNAFQRTIASNLDNIIYSASPHCQRGRQQAIPPFDREKGAHPYDANPPAGWERGKGEALQVKTISDHEDVTWRKDPM